MKSVQTSTKNDKKKKCNKSTKTLKIKMQTQIKMNSKY